MSGSIIIQRSPCPRPLRFLTSVRPSGLVCVRQMLAFEWQLVGMVTKMGPVDRSPVLLAVQAAARLAAAVLLRVVQVFARLLLQVKGEGWVGRGGGHSDETVAVAASLGQKTGAATHSNIWQRQLRVFF